MTFLVWRVDPKTGKRFGPYAVESIRIQGYKTPRQKYLGRAVVKEDGIVELKRTGETLGKLGERNGDKIRVDEIMTEEEEKNRNDD